MALKEKLDLLDLSEEERKKAESKFLATLSFVSENEIKEVVDYLNAKGIRITKAKEIKILGDSKVEIAKKFGILEEIHEEGIYRSNPLLITRNALDIYKKIMYCVQLGKPYKKEDGTYEEFLFSEIEWQKSFNKGSETINKEEIKDDVISFDNVDSVVEPILDEMEQVVEPLHQEELFSNDMETLLNVPLESSSLNNESLDVEMDEDNRGEVISFANLKSSVEKMQSELGDIDSKTSDLAAQRQALEQEYNRLDDFKNSFTSALNDEFIGFGEIEPESYGMRRAA